MDLRKKTSFRNNSLSKNATMRVLGGMEDAFSSSFFWRVVIVHFLYVWFLLPMKWRLS